MGKLTWPWYTRIITLALTIICLETFPIITIDTFNLRMAHEIKLGHSPAIHDIYKIHMQSTCYGDYPNSVNVSEAFQASFTCTGPSLYCKFAISFYLTPIPLLLDSLVTNFLNSEIRAPHPNQHESERDLDQFNKRLHVVHLPSPRTVLQI
jgi:hypothetical protein